ncbi:MAG: hypothetical protein D8M59_05485 [Planctomycetes bacterium]|nr:hypothetical protein [Planctomycetota bacterium]NOG55970.1 hypothetical protein [Planctomycetota bacterium]
MRRSGRVAGLLSALTSVMLGVTLLLGGCAGGAPQDVSLLRIDAQQYDEAFDLVLDTLHAKRYVLDRVDRRLGVIMAEPQDSPSLFEFWKPGNKAPGDAFESTLHHQQRLVRIEFRPATAGLSADEAAGTDVPDPVKQVLPADPPTEPGQAVGGVYVDVICTVERSHRPGRRIETSSLRHGSYATDPLLKERRIPSRFWEPIGRDALTERWLRKQIVKRDEAGVFEVQYVQSTPELVDEGA